MMPKTDIELATLYTKIAAESDNSINLAYNMYRQAESELLPKIEALDKANTEKESQIVSLQSRIDFQIEANDILYADQKKELKNVIAGKIALQTEVDQLKAENEKQKQTILDCMFGIESRQSEFIRMVEFIKAKDEELTEANEAYINLKKRTKTL